MFRTGRRPQPEPYKVEGIGQDEKPANVDFSVIDEIHAVGDKDSFLKTRLLARTEGIFAGGSSGTAVHVAMKISEELDEKNIVVTIIPDSGTRYLSKIYNDNWMKENQFVEAQVYVRASEVVRDKVRRTDQLVAIPLGITVGEAVNLMRDHDISQVPVIEGGEVVGSMSETRILDILVANPQARMKPVAEYMERPFPVVSDDSSLTDVAKRMDRDTSAILVRQPGGFDIITKSDLISFLTKQKT
jgi:cystathionine beta-synthase